MKLRFVSEGFGLRGGTQQSGSTLYYRPTDRPNDLIKIVPALKSTRLKSMLADPHKLPDFTGQIFYGFEITESGDYRDKPARDQLKPFKQLERVGGDLNTTVGEAAALAGKLLDPRRYGMHGVEADPRLAKAYEAVAKHLSGVDVSPKRITGKDTLQSAMAKIVDADKGRLHDLAYEIGKRIKALDPRDKEVTDKFIELSRQLVLKLPGRPRQYDFVVYPESSSRFNTILADQIASDNGGMATSVSKLVRSKVEISMPQLYARALAMTKGKPGPYKVGSKENTQYYNNPTEFATAWAQNEFEKAHNRIKWQAADKPPAIKQIQPDKRRYVKIYDPAGVQDVGEYGGDKILILDDNIVSGSTLELIHELLSRLEPKPSQIDLFVPLRLPV